MTKCVPLWYYRHNVILVLIHTNFIQFIMPPFEEKGVYCFAHVGLSVGRSVCLSVCLSVCPSTRWLSDDNSRTLGPRIMKLHRNIDHDSQMRPIDFEVTWSKVKVTVTRNSKMVFE